MSQTEGLDYRLSGGGLIGFIERRIVKSASDGLALPLRILTGLAVLWFPLALMTLAAGTFASDAIGQAFITDVVPQVRFLVAFPLLLYAGTVIDPAISCTIRNLDASGVVPGPEKERFRSALARLEKARDSVWSDILLLLMAFALTWAFRPGYGGFLFDISDKTWLQPVSGNTNSLSLAGWWYLLVSAPVFQFVLFRWLWRYLLWSTFLFRLSRMRLALHATHPDLAGGLGALGLSQQAFVILFVALSTIVSSTIAHDMMFARTSFESARLEVIAFVLICVIAVYVPLTFFARNLYLARQRALEEFGTLGFRLSETFRSQWITQAGSSSDAPPAKSIDPSAVADYGAVFETARNTRVVPASIRSIVITGAALVVPFMPLYMLKFSVTDLINRLLNALV